MATKSKAKIVKVTGNTSEHGFQIGEKITVSPNANGGNYFNGVSTTTGMRYGINKQDFTEFPMTDVEIKNTIGDLQKKFKSIQDEIDYWSNAIDFMNENKLSKFDETEFKTYSVIKTINKDMSDIEKARIIAKIINSEL